MIVRIMIMVIIVQSVERMMIKGQKRNIRR